MKKEVVRKITLLLKMLQRYNITNIHINGAIKIFQKSHGFQKTLVKTKYLYLIIHTYTVYP